MAKATIGGEEIEVSFPNFKALKGFWPFQKKILASEGDPELTTEAVLGMVVEGSGGAYTLDQLEARLLPTEIVPLNQVFMPALMRELGFAGEVKPEEDKASPSTATSTASSPKSSRRAAADGTK